MRNVYLNTIMRVGTGTCSTRKFIANIFLVEKNTRNLRKNKHFTNKNQTAQEYCVKPL